jgi:hypothetical protein
MKNKKPKPAMTFRQAVLATPDIATGYEAGLSAMGADSVRVSVTNTTQLRGSVDIDSCTTAKYPDANRWAYALAYKDEVFFVEIHSANTGEVRTVLRKLQWLKDWLYSEAPDIDKLKAKSRNPFVWIHTKNFQIPKSTPQYKAAIKDGLLPIRKLDLN